MQLSPLQSRLAASMIASCLILSLCFFMFSPQFALAADVPWAGDQLFTVNDLAIDTRADDHDDNVAREPTYEPEFDAFDRDIVGRAPAGVTALVNNAPHQLNIETGTKQVFVFEKSSLSGRSQGSAKLELRALDDEFIEEEEEDGVLEERAAASTKTVMLSANTCIQPQAKSQAKRDSNSNSTASASPPQLTMYVSKSAQNTSPGPDADANSQTQHPFVEGAIMLNVSSSEDIYLAIVAPNVSTSDFSGIYNYEVAASTDTWFHSYNSHDDADLIWVDSDATAALLITHNLTDSKDPAVEAKVMSHEPYVMFAQDQDHSGINGLRYSFCGLKNSAQIAATKDGKFSNLVTTRMTKRGLGGHPKQQFVFSGLNSSSSYIGILAAQGNGTQSGGGVAGGGGHVQRATTFDTKRAGGNCELVVDLEFCNETEYSVPGNSQVMNQTQLAQFYDDYAKEMYSTFQKVLAQIPCEAPKTQQYSLVRNCSSCEQAYKRWLCVVAIPRCEDFSKADDWLQPRAVRQRFPDNTTLGDDILGLFPDTDAYSKSRNPIIDEKVRPGPYKEVLPCADLCYDLVQSCPAAMGFACPISGTPGYNTSYRARDREDINGSVKCNYPGSAHFSADASQVQMSALFLAGISAFAVLFWL